MEVPVKTGMADQTYTVAVRQWYTQGRYSSPGFIVGFCNKIAPIAAQCAGNENRHPQTMGVDGRIRAKATNQVHVIKDHNAQHGILSRIQDPGYNIPDWGEGWGQNVSKSDDVTDIST